MTPHSAPEVPPAWSDQASPAWRDGPGARAAVGGARAACAAARGAALHADAVVAVAGDGVDPAELVGVGVDRSSRRCAQRGQNGGGAGARHSSVAAGSTLSRPRSATSAACAASRRRSRGGTPGCRPGRSRALQFVVEPEQGEREAGHVEARDENSPTSGSTSSSPASREQLGDAAVDDEQLLVLDASRGR